MDCFQHSIINFIVHVSWYIFVSFFCTSNILIKVLIRKDYWLYQSLFLAFIDDTIFFPHDLLLWRITLLDFLMANLSGILKIYLGRVHYSFNTTIISFPTFHESSLLWNYLEIIRIILLKCIIWWVLTNIFSCNHQHNQDRNISITPNFAHALLQSVPCPTPNPCKPLIWFLS